MYDNKHFEHLETLDKWELENERQDIRGRPLITETGERLGMIEHLLVDRDHERVAAVRLADGRTFPVEPLDIRDDAVVLGADDRTGTGNAFGSDTDRGGEERIPLVEEKLVVGKREVETGGIRVRSRVVEQPVSEQVRLRDEHVEVERRPVDKRIGDEDADGLFRDRTVEMSETDEEAVVGKEARVREELVVRKDVDQHVEQISDTVRRTEVEVDEYDGSDRDSRR